LSGLQALSAFAAFGRRRWVDNPTLEELLTRIDGFGLTTASPVQRAICRILDGRSLVELAEHPDVIEALGGRAAVEAYQANQITPVELLLLAGIRSGKSLIVAACAVRAALTCDLSILGPGEVPRVSVLSLSLDTARATWSHVRGRIEASPVLRPLLDGEPTADTLTIRRPKDGRLVEIRVVAGSRAAGSLVARWSAGAVFDEAPRMVGAEDGVVNLDDARQSVMGRLLPGAQVLLVGSVWAPFGPTYDLDRKHFGKPSAAVVVVKATGPQMNPGWWTPERCAELKKKSPDAYAVDVENRYMNAAESMMTLGQLEQIRRPDPAVLPANDLFHYVAAMDPATRGNAWTLTVGTRDGQRNGKPFVRIALAKQWIGSTSEPLSPREILGNIRDELAPYRVSLVYTDQWAIDANRDLAMEVGLQLLEENMTGVEKVEKYTALRTAVIDQTIELPPEGDVLRDLAAVRKRVTQSGVSIELPRTADGRHCDYAPVVAIVLEKAVELPDVPGPVEGTREWREQYKAERLKALRDEQKRKRRTA
jgi:hypothetical protein